MTEETQVETSEPTETQNDNIQGQEETEEPSGNEAWLDSLMGGSEEVEDDETSDSEETEESETEETDTPENTKITLKIGETEESFDISDETQKSKLVEFAQKGRHYEQKMSEVKKIESEIAENTGLLNRLVGAAQMAHLNNIRSGEIQLNEPDWVDYATDMQYESEADAKEAYRRDKESYKQQTEAVQQYSQSLGQSAMEYQKQKKTFSEAHPEVTDVGKWIKENVDKFIEPFSSMGAKPLPNDLFEMVYFWNNKSKYEQKIREEERKNIAKAKTKVKAPVTVKGKSKPSFGNDAFINALMTNPSENVKLIKN